MSLTACIGIIPMGEVSEIVPKVVAAHIDGYLGLDATILDALPNPIYALNQQRLQFDAGAILARLEESSYEGVDKVVGLLAEDLFLPIFTHVFGEARQGGRAALVSLFRLGLEAVDGKSPAPIVLERSAKIALHEICHLYNLTHCENRRCLMCFSGDLDELDKLSFDLCRYCRQFFREAVA